MLNEELIRKYAAAHESCYLYSQKEITVSVKQVATFFDSFLRKNFKY